MSSFFVVGAPALYELSDSRRNKGSCFFFFSLGLSLFFRSLFALPNEVPLCPFISGISPSGHFSSRRLYNMDSISRLLLATYPPVIVDYSKNIRLQSLVLICFSAIGVLVAIVNFSTSPYSSIISGVFFMVSSLAGVPVGVYAYNTSRKVKSPYTPRYRILILAYSIVYVAFLLVSGVLQFLKIQPCINRGGVS